MKLIEILGLSEGSIVSIVGAGGKSTLMYAIAEELRKDNKCLVTTTTKIYYPDMEQYDYIAIGEENTDILRCSKCKGIYVYGSSVNEEGKLLGISSKELARQAPYFDCILVEADGAKRKPIKGWSDTEPVICSETQKTIGVLSIESLGKEINENNVHRVKEFINISGEIENGIITVEGIVSLIFHPRGLFKNSHGERVLFINKVETAKQKKLAEELMNSIQVKNRGEMLIDRIIFGSLMGSDYHQGNPF